MYKIEDFYRQKEGKTKEGETNKKIDYFRQGHLPLGESLTRMVTSLVLTRKFQIDLLKVTFLGKAENAMKSWLPDISTSDSILGLLLLFSNGLSGVSTKCWMCL